MRSFLGSFLIPKLHHISLHETCTEFNVLSNLGLSNHDILPSRQQELGKSSTQASLMLKMSRGRLDVGDVPKASVECRVVVASLLSTSVSADCLLVRLD